MTEPTFYLNDMIVTNRKRRARMWVILAVVIVLAAAGASTVTYALLRSSGTVGSSAPIAGCTEYQTEELYVVHAYKCPDESRVVTFNNDRARDDWLKMAEYFGAEIIEQGPMWVRYRH